MSFKRFLAPNSRLAMEAVRREVGDHAVILSNRKVGDQVEIVATCPDTMEAIVEDRTAFAAAARSRKGAPTAPFASPAPPGSAAAGRRGATAPASAARPAARALEAHGGAAMYASIAEAPGADDANHFDLPAVAARTAVSAERAAPAERAAAAAKNSDPKVRAWSPPLWRGATVRFGADASRTPRRKNVASTIEPARPAPVSAAPSAAHAAPRTAPLAPAATRSPAAPMMPTTAPGASVRATVLAAERNRPRIEPASATDRIAAHAPPASIQRTVVPHPMPPSAPARVLTRGTFPGAAPVESAAAAGDPAAVFRRRPSRLGQPPAVPRPGFDHRAAAPQPGFDHRIAAHAPAANTYAPPPELDFGLQDAPLRVDVRAPAHRAAAAARAAAPAPVAVVPAAIAPAVIAAAATAPAQMDPRVLAELQSMRTTFSQQIAALGSSLVTTLAAASRKSHAADPAAASAAAAAAGAGGARSSASADGTTGGEVYVMMRLLTSGFSPELARRIAQHAPQGPQRDGLDAWLQQAIASNLRCADPAADLIEARGALALIGPTGVGKTTTLAKLAARFAVRHGAGALGLITLDTYRIGAHEQLRAYGRILGAPVHVAHDGATLHELLAAMKGRRLVLIDTCGVAQRDQRLAEMLALLDTARCAERPVRRLLLLNAALHVETLDDVARSWRASDTAGIVLTKIDEAARLGGALDCALRHRTLLMGLTNGQRVPEDWHAPNAQLLAHIALKPVGASFDLAPAEAAAMVLPPALAVAAADRDERANRADRDDRYE